MNLAELPNRRVEAWKYSDLRAAAQGIEHLDLSPGWHKFSLVTDEPATVVPFVESDDVVGRLARATGDGQTSQYIVPAGGKRALVLDWEAIAGAGGFAVEINVGENAELTVVENWIGEAGGMGAGKVTVNLAKSARATRVVVQRSSAGAVLVSGARVHVGTGARFKQCVLAEGAKLARLETHVAVEGEGTEVELNGVYLAGANLHADLTSVIEHKVGGGTTRQLIKGVAARRGRGVFQGKIVVAPHAQKTDARQYHHGMLLEDGAEIFAKPELMIHADDVQCAHGNTAGGLDERALFYMRSRGVPEAEARALLIESFLVEAIPEGLPGEIRDELTGRIGAWLRETRA